MKTYLFYRENGFYPIELKDDNEAIENAKINNGTKMVTDTKGLILWQDKITDWYCKDCGGIFLGEKITCTCNN